GEYLTWLMKARAPSGPPTLIIVGVAALFVTTQVWALVAHVMYSDTLVVRAMRRPHPVVAPAGPHSSPPAMPPWKMSNGRMNDCVSPVHAPRLLVHEAPPTVQLAVHRLSPP